MNFPPSNTPSCEAQTIPPAGPLRAEPRGGGELSREEFRQQVAELQIETSDLKRRAQALLDEVRGNR